MLENELEYRPLISTVTELLKDEYWIWEILKNSNITIYESNYDSWNWWTTMYTVWIISNLEVYSKYKENIFEFEKKILENFQIITRNIHDVIESVIITPLSNKHSSLMISNELKGKILDMITEVEELLLDVWTRGRDIKNLNEEYKEKYRNLDETLKKIGLKNTNFLKDLWQWYHYYKDRMPTYKERWIFIKNLFTEVKKQLQQDKLENDDISLSVDLSSWERLERAVQEIKLRELDAKNEEQFQAIWLLCREGIITLAQAVFIKQKHLPTDWTDISNKDAKRMLEAYIQAELWWSSNESLRKFAKSLIDFANVVTHDRNWTRKNALICINATISLINFIWIIEWKIKDNL